MSSPNGYLWYCSTATQRWDRCDEAEAWDENGNPNNDYVDALFNDIDQRGGVHLISAAWPTKLYGGCPKKGANQHWIATRNGDVVGWVL